MRHAAPFVTVMSMLAGGTQTRAADLPKSKAEQTNYESTSTYAEVQQFFGELQKQSPLIRLQSFGKTVEGREMPLVILSDPPVSDPRQAAALNKPIVFIMANIHAGEVEGKEAVQHLSRRIVSGELRPLLDKLVILIAPIYNADGNEKVSVANRTAQYGPVNGVGVRENSQGLDLNRDYMKIDAPETAALIGVLNAWDPHITVDLHTTNGSYHGYHLTYSAPLNPMTDTNIFSYHHEKMLPAITEAMLRDHKYRAYYYGNFNQTFASAPPGGRGRAVTPSSASAPATSTTTIAPAAAQAAWYAFSPAPRVGQNYIGLRNRLTILSEAYSYLDFKARVEVTDAFVQEIFQYAAAHGDEIRALTRKADEDAVARAGKGSPVAVGVGYDPQAYAKSVDILMGEVTKIANPKSGRDMTAAVLDKFTPTRMMDYRFFTPKRTVAAPRAYLFRDEPGMKVVVEKLQAHGIVVETLTVPLEVEVDRLTITAVQRSAVPFQKHNEVGLRGDYKAEKATYPAGSILVRTAQPLGTLAAYLLEPESDDGLATWNFVDEYLGVGKVYPVGKVMGEFKAETNRVAP